MIQKRKHEDLLTPTRKMLELSLSPWVIENVPGAPMRSDLILCGSMFGLGYEGLTLYRHRLFEGGGGFRLEPWTPSQCDHAKPSISVFGHSVLGKARNGKTYSHMNERERLGVKAGRIAMGIGWMTGKELSQAIPPAYTEFIGLQLIQYLRA